MSALKCITSGLGATALLIASALQGVMAGDGEHIDTFCVKNYTITQTRARHEDTNHIRVALSVNGQMTGEPQTKFMGNENNGTFPVNLCFPDVKVPDNATVTMAYQILNSGHKHSEVTAVLKAGLSTRLGAAANVVDLVFPNCDGPITPPNGRQLVWGSDALAGVAPGTEHEGTQVEPGNDSPHGCGKNSHYVVRFTISKK